MPRIKKSELEKVYNSIYKPKERVLPFNQKKKVSLDEVSDIKTSKKTIYFIDGYNLMFASEEIKKIAATDLISAREKLINLVCDFNGYLNQECILVFDAYLNTNTKTKQITDSNINVVYTKQGQTADMYIEQVTKELSQDYKIIVVTSDGLEQLKILANDCLRLSSKQFLKKYQSLQNKEKRRHKTKKVQPLFELRSLLFQDDE